MNRGDLESLSFYPFQRLRKCQANLHTHPKSPSSPRYLICNMTAIFHHKVNRNAWLGSS